MKNPKAIVIDDELSIRSLVKDCLKTSSQETGIEFKVQTYEKCPDNIKEIKDATLYFIDFFLPGLKGNEIAMRLKEAGSTGARVLISGEAGLLDQKNFIKKLMTSKKGQEKEFHEWLADESVRLVNEGLVDAIIPKPFEIKEIKKTISHLRTNRRLTSSLSLGIIGLGKEDSETYKGFKETANSDKIRLNSSLEEIIEHNPDIIFIATGLPFDAKKTRNQLFTGTAEKVYPILKELKRQKYQGLIIMGSNPLGSLLMLADEFDLPRSHLVGESVTDTVRARKLLAKRYPEFNWKQAYLEVLGNHSEPVPLLSEARVNNQPVPKPSEKERKEFEEELRKKGKEIMKYAERTKDYDDAPLGIMEMLDDIAHFQEKSSSSWMIYSPQNMIYTSLPARIIYPTLDVSAGELPEMSDKERKKLREQVLPDYKSQKRAVKFILEKRKEGK